VLADAEWHAGVIGIVAGRLADKHQLPTIIVALDPLGVKPGIGSARSVPGFDLHAALAQCGSHLESHGGHAHRGAQGPGKAPRSATFCARRRAS
jgi:single-stranded-DNA-specific exonuclease